MDSFISSGTFPLKKERLNMASGKQTRKPLTKYLAQFVCNLAEGFHRRFYEASQLPCDQWPPWPSSPGLVWSPLAKINIPQNKGVARRGTDLPTKQSARIKHTCVVICFCVHLLFLSIITFIVALTTPVLYSSENEIKGTNISAHTIHWLFVNI